jgi:hypothetical protein
MSVFHIEYRTDHGDLFGQDFIDREKALTFARATKGRARLVESDGVFMKQVMTFNDGIMTALSERIGDRMVAITEEFAR